MYTDPVQLVLGVCMYLISITSDQLFVWDWELIKLLGVSHNCCSGFHDVKHLLCTYIGIWNPRHGRVHRRLVERKAQVLQMNSTSHVKDYGIDRCFSKKKKLCSKLMCDFVGTVHIILHLFFFFLVCAMVLCDDQRVSTFNCYNNSTL